jgi:hypothetical protein
VPESVRGAHRVECAEDGCNKAVCSTDDDFQACNECNRRSCDEHRVDCSANCGNMVCLEHAEACVGDCEAKFCSNGGCHHEICDECDDACLDNLAEPKQCVTGHCCRRRQSRSSCWPPTMNWLEGSQVSSEGA